MYTYRRGSYLLGLHAAHKRRQWIKQHRRARTNVHLRLPRMQLVRGVQVELHQRLTRQAENVLDPGAAPRRHSAHGLPHAPRPEPTGCSCRQVWRTSRRFTYTVPLSACVARLASRRLIPPLDRIRHSDSL